MNEVTTNTAARIKSLLDQKAIKSKEIEIRQIEISRLNEELFSLEWVEISWIDLELWLKNNRPDNDYEKNPVVSTKSGNKTYCVINKDGELKIGPYYHNDIFPRGKPLLIRYDFESYRD